MNNWLRLIKLIMKYNAIFDVNKIWSGRVCSTKNYSRCSIILLNRLPEKWTDGLKKTEESEVKVNASLDEEGRNQKEESALKFASMCRSMCGPLLSQDTCLKVVKYVCSRKEREDLNDHAEPWENRGTSLWMMSFDVQLMDTLERILAVMWTPRGDTSTRHQWGFVLSLRYPYLLCFQASSIKYESLRQKEGGWKGRERGPQRAPLDAFEETLRQAESWAQTHALCTYKHTHADPLDQWVGGQISTFASSVFDHFSQKYHKGNIVHEIRPKSLTCRC